MHTLGELIDIVYEESWRHQKDGETSRRNAEMVAMYIGPGTLVSEIMDHHLRGAAKYLEEGGNSGATVNRKMSAFGKVMSRAEEMGMVDRAPRAVRRPESAGRIRWFSEHEEQLILAYFQACHDAVMRDLVIFLLDTGMRLGEALNVEDGHISGNLIHIWETKADQPRTVPMTKRVQEIAKRREFGSTDGLIPITKHAAESRWAKMRADLDYSDDPDFVMHTCRHTCASRLVTAGVSLAVVQAWLGHKSIQTTMRYAHLRPEALMEAVSVLET